MAESKLKPKFNKKTATVEERRAEAKKRAKAEARAKARKDKLNSNQTIQK